MVLNKHKIGDFRDSVGFNNNNPIPKGAGQQDVYSTFYTCRGKLTKDSGNRGIQFGEISGADTYTLIIRFRQTLFEVLKVNMKVTINEEFFTIASFEKVDNLNHLIKFKLNKKQDA